MQWKFESSGVSHSQIYWFESCFCRPGVNFTLLLSPFLPDSDAQYLEPPIPLPLPLQLSLHYNDSFSILLLLFLLSDTHSAANFCESLLSPAPLCVCPAPIGNNNGSGSVSRCEIMVTRAGCSHYLPILLCTSLWVRDLLSAKFGRIFVPSSIPWIGAFKENFLISPPSWEMWWR